jgi:protein-S-isoprenylcysteine O-methyltransferase Ste14
MRALELKVPPPVVAVLVAAAMWAVSRVAPMAQLPYGLRLVAAIVLVLAGVGIAMAGVVAFHRAKTTVNPLKPEASSALVTSGVYRVTRNPMYVGMALALVGWAFFLSSVWSLLGPLVFVFYMTRFQIIPEERALSDLFGAAFSEYRSNVRRWL